MGSYTRETLGGIHFVCTVRRRGGLASPKGRLLPLRFGAKKGHHMFAMKRSDPPTRLHGSGMPAPSRWVFALAVLVFAVTPQVGLAGPRACIPAGDTAHCSRDTECCTGSVCIGSGVCKRGCKINKVYYDNGTINPGNDCQWCQAGTNRFGWTNRVVGAACGNRTDSECTNPDTCNGAGSCLPNHEPTTVRCGDTGTECTNQDYCNGSGGCTDNGFKSSTTACTDTTPTDCLAAECNGSGACDQDGGLEAAGDACGDQNDTVCDDPNTCNATGTCLENHEPATTTCGDPTDTQCNNPDHCSGTDGSCVNAAEPTTTRCGDAEGPCTNQDFCDGSGACDDNGFKSAATSCGDPTNTQCDNPDHCSGTDGNCVPAYEPAGTGCGDAEGACIRADACDGSGGCTDNGFKPSTTTCTGTANGGACDGTDHCSGTSNTCVDGFKPSSHACVLPRDAFGNYTCREVAYCTGTSSTCPTPDIQVFDPTIPCRDGGFGVHEFCNPPEYCTSYGVCAASQIVPGGTCNGGPRAGQFCDDQEASPCGAGYACVRTVCPGATLPCERPWTCDYSGHCLSNGLLPAGTDCIGELACEKYRCDTAGDCVDQNERRSPTASCRPAANECDVREFCGDPSVVPSNGRSDFTEPLECGPDEKKPWGTLCEYQPSAEGDALPGRCSLGVCDPYYCKNSIECPDGFVCGCPPGQTCDAPYCVPAPTEGGYGDVCTVRGRCNQYAESRGLVCTTRQQCDPGNIRPLAQCLQKYCDYNSGTHQNYGCESDTECNPGGTGPGKCIADTQGDCGAIPDRTLNYVCCAGMQGDGAGGTPALGQTGRCQECCDTSIHDACAERSEDLVCCDGKCTDVVTDIHNCGACNYDPSGRDCIDLINACSPGVVECDAANIGGGCVMSEYCDATARQNSWEAASCDIPQDPIPVPECDYCVFPTTTPGTPCLTDADCGGFFGSCYHDPSLFCFVDRRYAYVTASECREAPFTGCTPVCTEIATDPNVGDECESDDDCFGGTTCKTSCRLTDNAIGWYQSPFCLSDPTCQW